MHSFSSEFVGGGAGSRVSTPPVQSSLNLPHASYLNTGCRGEHTEEAQAPESAVHRDEDILVYRSKARPGADVRRRNPHCRGETGTTT